MSPLLFVLIMEYFHRVLQSLSRVPNFNFHPKCEKMKIINLRFADDILMFVRGDLESIKLLMDKVRDFSTSTGLKISVPKSKIYFGGVDDNTINQIQQETGFAVGNMPFRYLGVPLASKKLTVSQCQALIEKMLARLKHWSTRLLSYVGRVQLLKSVIFSIANYWMQIFPSPKKVISHINSICSSFMWTGKESLTRKAPVAWDHICNPLSAGGLNMISLLEWNKATIGKLLWNVCEKKDRLWINWIHAYYIKKSYPTTFCPGIQCSWILKAMFKHRDDLLQSDVWKGFQNTGKYVTRKIYHMLRGDKPKVTWRKIFYGNLARPIAKFILWMTCLDRLPTKDRLHRFGVVTDSKCVFCGLIETCDHLFFECATTKKVWADILRWISIMRIPGGWHSEL